MDDPASASDPHFPFPNNPASHRTWREYVRPYTTPSLSTCLTEGLLRLDGARMAATWIDVFAMRLVEWAVAGRRDIALISPDPYDLLVPLTAAAVHIRRMIELKKAQGGSPRSDVKVAVVTPRMGLRSAYRRLGLGTAKLFESVPAATRLPTGAIAVLGRNASNTDWSTLFVNRATDLRDVRGISLIIVDLPNYDWEQLKGLTAPKVFLGHDPADRTLQRLTDSIPVFAWDANDLRGLAEVRAARGSALEPVACRLERLAAGVSCSTRPVRAQNISQNAALFWSDIGPLHRAAGASHLGRELAAEAHELFQDLLHLAVPTATFEEQSGRTLAARLRELKHDEFRARGDLKELYLPMVHADLRDMASAIGDCSPKAKALVEVLREAMTRRRRPCVVTRTAAMARAQRAYLQEFADLRRVEVTTLTEVAEREPADVAVLTGLAPAWARHVYLSGLASELVVLAYDAESDLTIADPFIELEQIRRTIAYQKAYASWLARPALKARCWERLSGDRLNVVDTEQRPPHVDVASVPSAAPPEAPDVPPGLWEVSMQEMAREGHLPGSGTAFGGDLSRLVDGLRLTFDDGRWAIVDRDGTVSRYTPGDRRTNQMTVVDATTVSVGDFLVFLDGDARKDVLGKVLEVAKDIPHLAAPATWVEYWRDSLRRARERYRTYNGLGEALRALGSQRETQTVRLWVVGTTIGPSDPLDVRRLGEALGDATLREHHTLVYQGINSFRNAHAQLMERVGALALHVGPAATSGVVRSDEVIDERSGLTAADFQDCIELLQVRSITSIGQVPFGALGRLHEAQEIEVL